MDCQQLRRFCAEVIKLNVLAYGQVVVSPCPLSGFKRILLTVRRDWVFSKAMDTFLAYILFFPYIYQLD